MYRGYNVIINTILVFVWLRNSSSTQTEQASSKSVPLPLFSTFAAAAASIHFWVPFYSRSNGPHQCPKHRVFPVDVDVESANNPYTTVTHFTGFSGKEVAGRLFVASDAGFLKTQWSNKWAS